MRKAQPVGHSCQLILGATEALSRARDLLVRPSPQSLDMACIPLATAIEQVTDLQTASAAPLSRDLNAALAGLRREIDLISRLLENAASYHVNLVQCMIEASGAPAGPMPHMDSRQRLSMDA